MARRALAISVVSLWLAGDAATSAAQVPRVRSEDPAIANLVARAVTQSATFRVVERIDRTDGIVYIAGGQCRHGGSACLISG
jgi:hypothetical protein